jgi:hypothetical protein
MSQPSDQEERGEGRSVVAAGSVILVWGIVIFLQWHDSMQAHDIGDFEASYKSYGVMLLITLLAVVSTCAVAATISWLRHRRLTKAHFSPGHRVRPAL